MNTGHCWMAVPRFSHIDADKSRVVANLINTWLYRTDQLERDPSLLVKSFYSSQIDGVFVTNGDITYKDRMAFNQVYRHF